MQHSLTVAVVQMRSTLDQAANLARAERLVAEAAERGARLVVLPEMFPAYGPLGEVVRQAESTTGPIANLCAQWAKRWKLWLVAGSMAERAADEALSSGKAYNTSLVFDDAGQLAGRYRKQHLFDVDLPGRVRVQESEHLLPGEESLWLAIPAATFPARNETLPASHSLFATQLGVAICYDLRFPELFRRLAAAGMDVLALPAAFTRATGEAHWHLLVRARAVENQCYVLAANQWGEHAPGVASYGHSMIVDPWGNIVAEAPAEGDAVLAAELDAALLEEVRARLPALKHRRSNG